MAKDVKANNKDTNAVKKPIIKNKTAIVLIIAFCVIISVVLFVTNLMKGKDKQKDFEIASEQEWLRVADYIKYLFQSSDLQITYKNTDKRNVIELIGRSGYGSILYSGDKLYISSNTYTSTNSTDEEKIREATSNMNSKQKIFAENITSFGVDNYDFAKDSFSSDTAEISFGVNVDINVRHTLTVKLQ